MTLVAWSWLFLLLYMLLMLGIGWIGQQKVQHADDYATARSSYGPVFLAFAFAATTASGATFLGGPGLVYELGLGILWSSIAYPCGVYVGVLICMKLVATAGNRFGNRSIPEFLGDRFQSDGIRLLVACISLVLCFYLAGQLVSGLVMFELMLGLEPVWAISITAAVLLGYVLLGGAHADIMTDGIQGFMMLLVACLVVGMAATGAGVPGGAAEAWKRLGTADANLVSLFNPTDPRTDSAWAIVFVFFSHIPLGLLPHLGNKLWALKSLDQRKTFIRLAFVVALSLAMLSVGGFLTRAIVGGALLQDGANPNAALPQLFISVFPTWLAALLGVGVLAAVMSTADGLVVSSSQIIANDLYRRTVAPRFSPHMDAATLDRRVLHISRWSTLGFLLGCTILAWYLQTTNIAMIVMIAIGGSASAYAGPLVLGTLWKGVTRAGAYAGILVGFLAFFVLHTRILNPDWFPRGVISDVVAWLDYQGPNPFACATLGEAASVVATVGVSLFTCPLPEDHVRLLFDPAETHASQGAESQSPDFSDS